MPTITTLTPTEQMILSIESQVWVYAGAKESAIRDQLDMSATRFYQALNAMLDDPHVEAADPVTVHRLQRVRASRRRVRVA
jgi:hypothetical protein